MEPGFPWSPPMHSFLGFGPRLSGEEHPEHLKSQHKELWEFHVSQQCRHSSPCFTLSVHVPVSPIIGPVLFRAFLSFAHLCNSSAFIFPLILSPHKPPHLTLHTPHTSAWMGEEAKAVFFLLLTWKVLTSPELWETSSLLHNPPILPTNPTKI